MAFTSSIRGSLLTKVVMHPRMKETNLAKELNATIHFQEALDVDIKFKEFGCIYVTQKQLANTNKKLMDQVIESFEPLRLYEKPFIFATCHDVLTLSALQMAAIGLNITLVPIETDNAVAAYLHQLMKKTGIKKMKTKVWNPENTQDRIHKLTDTVTRIDPMLKIATSLAKSVTFKYNSESFYITPDKTHAASSAMHNLANADLPDLKTKLIEQKQLPEVIHTFFNAPLK